MSGQTMVEGAEGWKIRVREEAHSSHFYHREVDKLVVNDTWDLWSEEHHERKVYSIKLLYSQQCS